MFRWSFSTFMKTSMVYMLGSAGACLRSRIHSVHWYSWPLLCNVLTVSPCEAANRGTKAIIWGFGHQKMMKSKERRGEGEAGPRLLWLTHQKWQSAAFSHHVSLFRAWDWLTRWESGDIDGREPCRERIIQSDLIGTVSISMFTRWPAPPLWSLLLLSLELKREEGEKE